MVARILAVTLIASSVGCHATPPAPPRPFVRDEHSFANAAEVRVKHVSIDLALDFAEQRASGAVELRFERLDPRAPLVLDTNDLEIEDVQGVDGTKRKWSLGIKEGRLGAPLAILLEPDDQRVRVLYSTGESSEALQWLAPAQTAGKQRPFLYTQGQAILTRSWIPLQDSPGVRITYDARIRVPEGTTAVMSAETLARAKDGAFRFRMRQPIPPYLIALASGELEFRALSERCGVWAEPPLVESAAAELADTESMVRAAERLFGPYRWERYDVIVLPPSFPYGGMENPRLTFATPTILAGDKSLVALVAHELAHSWSGNLVTNATWRDFWLNEGFTVYCENRIMEVVYGKERAATERVLEIAELEEEMAGQEPWQQVLHVDLTGKHPDDGFSNVPYTKGALLLSRLEQVFGRKTWDAFLRGYFERNAFQSITTADFRADLERELLAGRPKKSAQVDIETWVLAPGLPADAPRPTTRSLEVVDAESAAYAAGKEPRALATSDWTTQQWLRFLRGLPAEVSAEAMAALDGEFHFTQSGNSEILCQWLELAIRHGYHAVDKELEGFLASVGRRKFLRPLYTALMASPETAERGKALYARFRPGYHSVSTNNLDAIVGFDDAGPP